MLAADRIRFGGANQDLLWKVFAAPGLGEGASSNGTDDPDPKPSFSSPFATEGTVRLLPAEDFPSLQPPAGTRVAVEAARFAEAVTQVARAASKDEARPILTGVLLEVSREGITLAATDSYRLAVREITATAEGVAKAIVPERAISEAGRAAAGEEKGEVELFVEQSQVAFRVGRLSLTSRLIEGEFPNYRQLLPEGYESRLVVSRQGLLEAVRRVGLMARDSAPVRLSFNALGVRLSSSSPDLGEAVETVEARYEGEDLTVAFNPQYLADGLQVASGETARLEVRDGLKPGIVRGDGLVEEPPPPPGRTTRPSGSGTGC
jgi:DNA polymerase III subunit beta